VVRAVATWNSRKPSGLSEWPVSGRTQRPSNGKDGRRAVGAWPNSGAAAFDRLTAIGRISSLEIVDGSWGEGFPMPGPTMAPAALNRRPEAVEDRAREAMIERVWVRSMGDLAVGNFRDGAG
jgi:hypothetical protein